MHSTNWKNPVAESGPCTLHRAVTTQRPESPLLGLVIPCFNEEDVIPSLLAEINRFIAECPHPVCILFVDDGSRDRTFELLSLACALDIRKACVQLSRNFGHQAAVSVGLKLCRGDVVAVLDADLQDPINVVPLMIEKWREGYDVVYGVRQNRKENWLLRSCYAAFYRLLKSIADINLPLDSGDFSIMDRRVVDQLNAMPEHNRFVRGLRGWVGFRQLGFPYDRQARAAGEPKYNLRRLVRLALDGLVAFSSAPLKLATLLGAMASVLCFILIVWALISVFFFDRTPQGWASLAILILFFSGVQLLVMGIIGEYVGRIFEEVKNRPQFVESRRAGWVAEKLG